MPYQPTSLVQRAWRHHPRCLTDLVATPLVVPPEGATVLDEYAYFSLSCQCGSKHFQLLGYPHPEAGLLCPVSVECSACNRTSLVFDVQVHGFDAEVGNGCYSMRGEGSPSRYACTHCAGTKFEVLPNFSYQIEPDDMSEEEAARAQDLFDDFNVEVRCSNCRALESPVGYECA